MKKNQIYLFFYNWFAIIPVCCVLLDLFLSTIMPPHGYNKMVKNFDFSFFDQITYFSVWNALLTSSWGILQLVGLKFSSLPKWCTSKNFLTTVVTYNFIVFFIFLSTFIFAKGQIIGFEGWYKILKSVLEHFVTPPLLILFYFIVKDHENVASNFYIKKIAWFNLIYPGLYLIFIFVRCYMLHTFDDYDNAFSPFPYDEINPYITKWYLVTLAIISVFSACYGFSILLNYSTNLIMLRRNNKLETLDIIPYKEKSKR